MAERSSLRGRGEKAFVRVVAHPALSRTMARLADLRLPRRMLQRLIKSYIRFYKVDMSEVAEPLHSFPTFNAFFTRKLKEGARPVDASPGTVVSPADSKLAAIGAIPEGGRLEQIKGKSYGLDVLLGAREDAAAFTRGVHATLYLSPSMYHRVHCPVDGRIVAWRHIPGRLFPVNAMAVRTVEGLFTVNERVSILIETREFGLVAVVFVGATNVGRITLAFAEVTTNRGGQPREVRPVNPVPIRRGDELGVFNLGSTLVLLSADPTLEPAGVKPGDLLRMGQPLWRRG